MSDNRIPADLEPVTHRGGTLRTAPKGARLILALSASIGCVFVGLFALACAEFVKQNSGDDAHWYTLMLSWKGAIDVIVMVVIAGIATWFLEPLIHRIREVIGIRDARHRAEEATGSPSANMTPKLVVGALLIITSMSHELVHTYVYTDVIEHRGVKIFEMFAVLVIIFGTTFGWSYGTRRGRAWLIGSIASLALAGLAFTVYTRVEDSLYNDHPSGQSEVNAGSAEQSEADGTTDALGISRGRRPRAVGTLQPPPVTAPADRHPDPLTGNDAISDTSGGVAKWFGKAKEKMNEMTNYMVENLQRLRMDVLFTVLAWVPAGLLGGVLLERRWRSAGTTVLFFLIVPIIGASDWAAQYGKFLAGVKAYKEHYNVWEIAFWAVLGLGWGCGIFVRGGLVDLVFGERK